MNSHSGWVSFMALEEKNRQQQDTHMIDFYVQVHYENNRSIKTHISTKSYLKYSLTSWNYLDLYKAH